jgi:hypothetical protein
LDEDIFFFSGIERFSIDDLEKRELFIESFSIVLLEITIEYLPSFFYEEASFFTIDKLSDMGTSLFRLYK